MAFDFSIFETERDIRRYKFDIQVTAEIQAAVAAAGAKKNR